MINHITQPNWKLDTGLSGKSYKNFKNLFFSFLFFKLKFYLIFVEVGTSLPIEIDVHLQVLNKPVFTFTTYLEFAQSHSSYLWIIVCVLELWSSKQKNFGLYNVYIDTV
jgi:hypothetical protein